MGMVDFKLGDIGNLFTSLREAITGEAIQDPNTKLELLKAVQEAESKMMEAKAKTIVAEANSEHWIAASWRPITMLTFVVIIANNYIVAPYLLAFGYTVPTLEIHPDMWTLLQLGLGGYIAGRSAEKVTKIYKGET
jgi:hypothetical protein